MGTRKYDEKRKEKEPQRKENRDMMIKMLGLREWSTKEDILRALAEIL